uniref:Uncharacterized protein n=1 Tax=Arundo donax TaxID=35708 RepID=A0A0A8YDV4_ARUDO
MIIFNSNQFQCVHTE